MAAIVTPGASASDMILSFSSVGHRRRRSTVEMISLPMCLTVLKYVDKDSMLQPIRHPSQAATAVVPSGRLPVAHHANENGSSLRCKAAALTTRSIGA